MKTVFTLSSLIKKQPFVIPPPVIHNDNDGVLLISDTEPLANPPDASWTNPIDVDVFINRISSNPDTFSVVAKVVSETSDNFIKLNFTASSDTLELELNVLANPIPHTPVSTALPSFTPTSGNPFLTVSITKGGANKKVGRKVHTISYANIKFTMKPQSGRKRKKPAKKQK